MLDAREKRRWRSLNVSVSGAVLVSSCWFLWVNNEKQLVSLWCLQNIFIESVKLYFTQGSLSNVCVFLREECNCNNLTFKKIDIKRECIESRWVEMLNINSLFYIFGWIEMFYSSNSLFWWLVVKALTPSTLSLICQDTWKCSLSNKIRSLKSTDSINERDRLTCLCLCRLFKLFQFSDDVPRRDSLVLKMRKMNKYRLLWLFKYHLYRSDVSIYHIHMI